MHPVVQTLLLLLTCAAAGVWTMWPIHYHLTTGGRWRKSQHGRNLQGLAVTIALLLDFSIVSSAGHLTRHHEYVPGWLIVAAFVLYTSLTYFGIGRHVLLWRDQHPAD